MDRGGFQPRETRADHGHQQHRTVRKKVGRPRSAAPKTILTLRLAQDVVAKLRASGPGYNARVEQILRDALSGRIKRRRIR